MKNKIILITILLFSSAKIYAQQASSSQTEIIISQDSLPSAIKEHLHKKYHDYSIVSSAKTTDKNGNITYKAEVNKSESSNRIIIIALVFDTSGKILSINKSKQYYYDGTEKSKPKPTNSNDGHNHQH